jgi:hypothetical protein
MSTRDKSAGLWTRAPHDQTLRVHLKGRLARTKRLLVGAYGLHALTFDEAEMIASRLRESHGQAWRAA